MRQQPRAAFVTVTYNGSVVWDDFLASVQAQDVEDWLLIVVDNASADDTRNKLAKIDDSRVRVILNDENVGVAAANNQGIANAVQAGADYVALINNDTTFPPCLLRRLLATIDLEKADAVSPLIAFHGDADKIWFGGGTFRKGLAVRVNHLYGHGSLDLAGREPFVTEYSPTCCLLVRSTVFVRIGMMDQQYFVYWDDVDFLWRMNLAEMRVMVDPGVVLLHKVSASTGGMASSFSIAQDSKNQFLFLRKFHGWTTIAYTGFVEVVLGLFHVVEGRMTVRQFVLQLRSILKGLTHPLGESG